MYGGYLRSISKWTVYLRWQSIFASIRICPLLDSPRSLVIEQGQLILLLDRFLYELKQSPLKFQLHLFRTLVTAGYTQSIKAECLFYKNKGSEFSYVSTHSDDLLHCVNYQIMANEFKNWPIKTKTDIVSWQSIIQYRYDRTDPMTYQKYVSQRGLTQRKRFLARQLFLCNIASLVSSLQPCASPPKPNTI